MVSKPTSSPDSGDVTPPFLGRKGGDLTGNPVGSGSFVGNSAQKIPQHASRILTQHRPKKLFFCFLNLEVQPGTPRLIYNLQGEKMPYKNKINRRFSPSRFFLKKNDVWIQPWIQSGCKGHQKLHPLGQQKHYNYIVKQWSLLVFFFEVSKKKVGSQRPLKDCLGLDMLRGDDDDDDDDDEDDVLLIKALSPLGGGLRLPCYTTKLSIFEQLP